MRQLIGSALLLLTVCTSQADAHEWQQDQQLVRVITADWDATAGDLQRYIRESDDWTPIGEPIAVTIGRTGSAWGLGLHSAQPGLQKREGDGRAPAGLFVIGTSFGYAEHATTGLDYQAMQAGNYCIDVPTSPLYNQIVDVAEVGEAAIKGNTEPMRRDLQAKGDDLYQLGFVIEHNAGGTAHAGSCIFAHVWRGPGLPTAGCTAMDADAMREVLTWLDRSRSPQFLLLPRDAYAELEAAWALPAMR